MKKIFSNFIVRMNKTFFVFATAAVCALGTVSCGGDDDGDEAGGGGSSAGNTESGVIQTPTGGAVRVAQAGEYTFSYNSDGTLASFFDGTILFSANMSIIPVPNFSLEIVTVGTLLISTPPANNAFAADSAFLASSSP